MIEIERSEYGLVCILSLHGHSPVCCEIRVHIWTVSLRAYLILLAWNHTLVHINQFLVILVGSNRKYAETKCKIISRKMFMMTLPTAMNTQYLVMCNLLIMQYYNISTINYNSHDQFHLCVCGRHVEIIIYNMVLKNNSTWPINPMRLPEIIVTGFNKCLRTVW